MSTQVPPCKQGWDKQALITAKESEEKLMFDSRLVLKLNYVRLTKLRRVNLYTSFSSKVSFNSLASLMECVRMSDHLTYVHTCLRGYQLDTHSGKKSLLQDRIHHCDRDSVYKHGLMKHKARQR